MRKITAPAGNTQICRLPRNAETQMTKTKSATKNRVGKRKKSTETKRMEKEGLQDANRKRQKQKRNGDSISIVYFRTGTAVHVRVTR